MDYQFLQIVTEAVFLILFALTIRDLLRHRDRPRLDVVVLFGTLAVTVLAQGYTRVAGVEIPTLATFGALFLVAQPFVLLRLVSHFRDVPVIQYVISLVGLVVSWALLIGTGESLPIWAVLVITVAFVYVEGYAAYNFIQAAFESRGVTRRRLIAVTIGSALLAAVFLVEGVSAGIPAAEPVLTPFSRLVAIGSAVAYYVGFVPPRWLLRSWQMAELRVFLTAIGGRSAEDRLTAALDQIGPAAASAVGGKAAVVAMAIDADLLEVHSDPEVRPALERAEISRIKLGPQSPLLSRAFHSQRYVADRSPAGWGMSLQRLAEAFGGAGSVLIAPLITRGESRGLLIVLLRRGPLFVEDELPLLAMLAEQAQIAIENVRLYARAQETAQQLQSSLEELQNKTQEVEAFVYAASHDLKAPLVSLQGYVDALNEEGNSLTEDQRFYLDRLNKNAALMERLIQGLLELSRVGRSNQPKSEVDTGALVDEIWRARWAPKTRAKVRLEVMPNMPVVWAERDLLSRVFSNFLDNSVKYAGAQPQPLVRVGWADGGDRWQFFVEDNGIGIPAQFQANLFRMFFRVPGKERESVEGSGMGLALAKKIIESHGGQTWIKSAAGEGTTVYFTLPKETT